MSPIRTASEVFAYINQRFDKFLINCNHWIASIRTNEPGLNEPSPITGVVPNPADITLAAEDTPARVKDLIRLAPIKAYDGRIRAPPSNSVDKYISKD